LAGAIPVAATTRWGRSSSSISPHWRHAIRNGVEVDCLTDFQLQVEHALDLQGRQRVLFVDASLDAPTPCSLTRIEAARDDSFTTHAMSPQAVLKVFIDIDDDEPPPCWLLAIRGERFELGEELSTGVPVAALQAALFQAADWIGRRHEGRGV
jgi:hydrogenase maturation protease